LSAATIRRALYPLTRTLVGDSAPLFQTTTEKGELRARTALRAHLGKREEKEKKPLRCDAARVPPLRAAAMATSWQQPATINDGGPPCLPEPAR